MFKVEVLTKDGVMEEIEKLKKEIAKLKRECIVWDPLGERMIFPGGRSYEEMQDYRKKAREG